MHVNVTQQSANHRRQHKGCRKKNMCKSQSQLDLLESLQYRRLRCRQTDICPHYISVTSSHNQNFTYRTTSYVTPLEASIHKCSTWLRSYIDLPHHFKLLLHFLPPFSILSTSLPVLNPCFLRIRIN